MKPDQTDTQRSFKNARLQYALLASFVLAAVLLAISHHAVENGSGSSLQLLSVPLPPREAAKGGLPPIPDFVKKLGNEDDAEAASIPSFPLPPDAVPAESVSSEGILQPTFGSHRATKNAVFAFAEGYDLNVYVTFVESLKNTGFTGDVVLSVSHVEGMKGGVEEYLKSYAKQDGLRVISYGLEWECSKKSGERISTNKNGRGSTTNHGFSDCKVHGLYSDGKDSSLAPAEDPREARPVATARYELYWIFSKQYYAKTNIMIIDVRDAFFQSDPFNFIPSPSLGSGEIKDSQKADECKLNLFEENYDAVNIAKSNYNSRWIRSAYGHKVLKEISSKPVLCSGSTMGSQHAIELYSVAMVAQFDKTKCKAVGCDQGFHNYLYYKGGLKQLLASRNCSINVYRQGDGAINNLAAMRNSSLRSQGVLKSVDQTHSASDHDNIVVFNNDGSTPSPVLHQFDRDKELKGTIRKRTSAMLNQWKLTAGQR